MPDLLRKLTLKGQAEEDIYFAERDRELIKALHKKKLHKVVQCKNNRDKKLTKQYEKRFAKITEKHKNKPKRLARACKELIVEIVERCSRRHGK